MSPFLLGVSLSSLDRVLGRTLVYTHGEASGFFVFGRFPADITVERKQNNETICPLYWSPA